MSVRTKWMWPAALLVMAGCGSDSQTTAPAEDTEVADTLDAGVDTDDPDTETDSGVETDTDVPDTVDEDTTPDTVDEDTTPDTIDEDTGSDVETDTDIVPDTDVAPDTEVDTGPEDTGPTDTDGDGLSDDEEAGLGTDPLNPDSDGDTLSDGEEVAGGTDPLNGDTDGDGLGDGSEADFGTSPSDWDSDDDGVGDADEIDAGTDPLNADSDGDGLQDGAELELDTDPLNGDTDGDWVSDGTEVENGTDPLNPDTDGDGLTDGREDAFGSDPLDQDTDDDGILDASEWEVGSDPTTPDEACVDLFFEAGISEIPIDIIITIDNSGSMGQEIEGVEDNINTNFADIINASGVNYRVIMIAQHGSYTGDDICVAAPLSGTDCSPIPSQPVNNPPIFYHYDQRISSSNSWSMIISTYNQADRHGFAPGGWSQWLREDAMKLFVEITDDDPSSYTAETFDAALLALSEAQFGTADDRNYIWHSIIGLRENTPADAIYEPTDPIVTSRCSTAPDEAREYQQLSIMTGGVRFPVCEISSYDAVFNRLAEGVIEQASLGCEIEVPSAPDDLTVDGDAISIQYTPSDSTEVRVFSQVPSVAECDADRFYVSGGVVTLCEPSCTEVTDDEFGRLDLYAGCRTGCIPEGPEICDDGYDNDCDGLTDEADPDCG